jgi:uncharacterized protein (DUF488 family)
LKTFCTIGYERVGQGAFVAALKAAKVKTLLDIREVANSRRAGFAKKSLAAALDEAGIAYIHMKALGTPKLGRMAARRGDTPTMQKIYKAHLAEPDAEMALHEAAEIAGKSKTCLMCLEHDWHVCHRAIVAQRLEKMGLKAQHLEPEALD